MLKKTIEEVEFVVFDTETTGLGPETGDRIVEIAAIKFKGRERIGQFATLVNPKRPISPGAQKVNNITPEMLKDAPGMENVLPGFLSFIAGTCLSSYNAPFDLAFLNSELKLQNSDPLNMPVVDVLKMARRLLPGLERYALWFVAQKLGINVKQEHRALSDAEMTLELFYRLNEILKLKNIDDFTSFLSLFGLSSTLFDDIYNQKLAKINQAIDLGVRLKIRYLAGSSGQISDREIQPKEIKQEKDRSYLVGYCSLRNEERTFRIDGILYLEIV